MSIVMVYELNNRECEHGEPRGFSCDECAAKRGQRLVRKLEEAEARVKMLTREQTND